MIRLFFLIFSLFIYFYSFGEPIDTLRAKLVAKIFLEKQAIKFNQKFSLNQINKTHVFYYQEKPAFYIFSFNPTGFVIVSADDNAFPILGYSFDSELNTNHLPPAFSEYLENAAKQVTTAIQNNKFKNVWFDIEHTPIAKVNKSTNAVAPLLTLKWDQDVPYNNYCPPHPKGPGGRCLTGCVATAMAMVMKYHNYPERGRGVKTFYWTSWDTIDYENTYYRWNQMTNVANSQSANAIAELMYHCGIAVNMDYGPYASGSYTFWIPQAMKYHFRYHPQIRYFRRDQFFDYEWDMMIRDELTNKRPVIYSGSGTGGHAFVCDGFQDTCFYHFNWGWGGYGDGYFYYNDLTPGTNDFSYGQAAVVYIMPYFDNYCVENFLLNDTARTFNDGSGYSYYWNNTSCSWLIKPKNGQNIWLYFNKFQTEPINDVLYIYDGQNDQAPLIGAFSGYTLPPTITSSGNALYLKFVTNDTIQGQGWEAYYSTTPVSVLNNTIEAAIRIYPNPIKDILFIENMNNTTYHYEIINLMGKKISSGTISNYAAIRVTDYQQGIYYIIIKNDNITITKKFTIIK
ncbi:MAG: C10 family peptidase [Bacteroidales bacterium]|nr:C10 family peptidase [Bacteroidales bacterium]